MASAFDSSPASRVSPMASLMLSPTQTNYSLSPHVTPTTFCRAMHSSHFSAQDKKSTNNKYKTSNFFLPGALVFLPIMTLKIFIKPLASILFEVLSPWALQTLQVLAIHITLCRRQAHHQDAIHLGPVHPCVHCPAVKPKDLVLSKTTTASAATSSLWPATTSQAAGKPCLVWMSSAFIRRTNKASQDSNISLPPSYHARQEVWRYCRTNIRTCLNLNLMPQFFVKCLYFERTVANHPAGFDTELILFDPYTVL